MAVFFNIGIGNGFSVLQVLAAAKAASGVDFATETVARRAGDPPQVVCDPTKSQRLLGFTPRYPSLATMLESSWDWEIHKNSP